MRLSQLEIKGFKSFADETIINFNEQVIGVVGPNGSGKSNIVDAIKWVLGEQKTKELRLESMSDVIFAGTKNRKPGKIARVTVNFSNTKNILPTEYNSVSISRLLYSNGQSEYRLNDVQCRKKDITSLFLDSGLGSNAYAIISLSMVEDILVDRENSRGRMIEEASGINKFKVRKKETLNKLKGTQADLDRVEDLLYELESNLKAFEKQARRTERYLKIKEEFKQVSLSWATRNGKKLNSEIKEIQTKLALEGENEAKIVAELNNKEAKLQKIKKEVLDKEGQLSEFQRAHNKLKEQIGALENQKGITQNELTFLNSGLKTAETEKRTLEKELLELEKEQKAKKEIYSDKSSHHSASKKEYEQKLHAFNAVKEVYDDIRKNLVSGQNEKDELRSKIEHSKREVSVKQSQIQLLNDQLDIKLAESKEVEAQLQTIEANLKEAEEKLSSISQSFNNQERTLQNLEEENQSTSTKINQLKENIRTLELKRDRSRQRAEILENVINSYEGFTESIQYLNNENKIERQLLSDILEIKEEELQEIIEFYFTPVLQHIIVQDANEAFSLNSMVRGAQKGKVSFLVDESMNESVFEPKNDQFIPLLSVLEYNSKHEKILKRIAGSAFIFNGSFEDLPLEDIRDNETILLPEELLIYKRGEIRGGSATLFEGVNIGRRSNLENLNSQVERLDNQIHASRSELETLVETSQSQQLIISEQSEKLKKLREDLQESENERNVIATRLSVRKNISNELQIKTSDAKQHILNVQGELDALIKLSESFSEKSIDEDNIEEMKADFDKYHKEFEAARLIKDEVYNRILKDENALNLIQRDLEQIEKSISEKSLKKEEFGTTIKRNNEKIESLLKKLDEIKNDAVKLYANEKEQYQKLNSQEEEFFSTKSGIYDKEKEIFELRGKRDRVTHLISTLKEKLSDKRIKYTGWKDRIEVEFNENISKYDVPEEYLEVDLDQLGNSRESLQIRLKSYGDINPLAIEAYNEIKLRVEKITAERDDILSAKLNLEETIRDIEQTASDLFTEALDQIRIHFKEVFRSLFSEDDDCDIVLLNADNPLESSIEIVAKPKGKKPKSINQLSGGEKTLTAVSFLFALYLLKPAPFCIFDEVDAPLDDVNIQKFNKIIRTFSKESQFIIVTHNKSTMAEMDILYGVFMQEAGVSGVAAVDFREFNKVDIFSKN